MLAPHPPMTLRRFVRVTLDNFRQLITAYSTPVTAPAMAPTNLSPSSAATASAERRAMPDVTPAAIPEMPEAADAPMALAAQPDDAATVGVTDAPAPEDAALAITAEAAPPPSAAAGPARLALDAAIESLLFVAEEPVEAAQLARVFGCGVEEIEAALQQLGEGYRAAQRGLRIQVRAGRYQLVTAPEAAGLIETFLNLDTSSKLSGPALETLAVVAYRQPVTRIQIEAVRGVDCSGVLRSLLQRGLLEEVGRLDAPGRPVLYGVSDLFMRHFGLTGLHDLPPLASDENSRIDEIIAVEETPPPV